MNNKIVKTKLKILNNYEKKISRLSMTNNMKK